MKLNNEGWDLREMILLSSGLLLALFISMFFIFKLYHSLEEDTFSNQYINLEQSLENAAYRYATDNDLTINGSYKLNLSTLKKAGYIDILEDKDNNKCGGYAIIENFTGNTTYEAYISCNDYTTKGY